MREYIDGAVFTRMLLCASDALEANKKHINELNVFPVPDGDTGTNMSLTAASAVLELRKTSPSSLSVAADCAAAAMLRGARGNSGVILSLLFRGIAKGLKGKPEANAAEFAAAMSAGVDTAYKAVMKPAEGTILTVSRKAAESAADFAVAGGDTELMLVCALESAKDALAETTEQNPVLKRAGVIDAGGQGYVYMLDAMIASLRGREPVFAGELKDRADFSSFKPEDIIFAYCTEFTVNRENSKPVDLLRAFLQKSGDSIVVIDDDELIKTHVHTNEPGAVLTEALTYGSFTAVKIENMRLQHSNEILSGQEAPTEVAKPEKKYGVVAVCAGPGVENLLRDLGTDRIVTGGQTMNPSTEDILKEINLTPSETVFVFPNNKNIIMAAEQCVTLSKKRVIVIPTKTVPQNVSALLNMDVNFEESELTKLFGAAIKKTHTALVTYAVRDCSFDEHRIKAGEYLILLDGSLIGSFTDTGKMWKVLIKSFSRFKPEFISVYYGEDADKGNADEVSGMFAARFPDAEVSLVNGGQPVYHYMISAE